MKKSFEFMYELDKKLDRLIGQKDMKIWFTTHEASVYLNVSKRTLQNLRNSKRINWSQFGRKIWFSRNDLDQFIESARILRNK